VVLMMFAHSKTQQNLFGTNHLFTIADLEFPSYSALDEIVTWCSDTFGEKQQFGAWDWFWDERDNFVIRIRDDADAVAFKLRWW
jgi:hypothetical protein